MWRVKRVAQNPTRLVEKFTGTFSSFRELAVQFRIWGLPQLGYVLLTEHDRRLNCLGRYPSSTYPTVRTYMLSPIIATRVNSEFRCPPYFMKQIINLKSLSRAVPAHNGVPFSRTFHRPPFFLWMEELENLVPQGPKRRESEPTVDDSNLQKTYDSYKPSKPPASKPSYDSYKPRNQPSVHSRRRPTAEEYWDQRLSPVSFTPPEHKSSAPSLGGSRRPSEALLATPGDSNFTRKDQDHTHGVGLEQRAANRSCVMDVDSPDPGLPKRSKADDLHVNTELTKTFGSKSNSKCAGRP